MSNLLPYQTTEAAQRIELEQGWEFLPDPSGRLFYSDLASRSGWRPARVGLSWNAQFEDLRDYMGAAWYRTEIDIPRFGAARHVLLKFGAVDYFCEVYVNDTPVGTHEGGYTPFSFDITSALRPGNNMIVIRVIDPPMNEAENRELFPEMMYNEIPHGKQSWYVQNSGIWQGVRLEFCPAIYVDRVDITPAVDGNFTADIRLAGTGLIADGHTVPENRLVVEIFDPAGRSVFREVQDVTAENRYRISGRVPHARLWHPESATLYVVDVTIAGAVQYRRRTRFGFRSFECRDQKFYLNGKPFYMIAALDQDFYPETIHTPASEEFVRDMMIRAKKLGINMLRCHLKVAHPVYLDIADELGMLVWAEMPSWSDSWFPSDHFSMRAAVRAERMFAEVVARDWNHPCIVVRTIMNESWGINLQDKDQRNWLQSTFDRVKTHLAPLGQLIVDNSACEGNYHLKTDIEDFHMYYSMPDQLRSWDKWLQEFASRAPFTFSPYGDAQRTGKEPLVVSEFGNWGLPTLPENEELPWWFQYSFGGRTVTNPAGVFERFHQYKLDTMFQSYNDFAEESQWHQFISLKYEIESMRAYGSIQGYVVTAMTDVHWEVNGLLDMWRTPKAFHEELERIQQPDLILLKTDRYTCFAGERITARAFLSHYSERDLAGARLRWSSDSGMAGQLGIPNDLERGSVTDLGAIEWTAPDVGVPTVERTYLELRQRNGQRGADNYADVFVVPRNSASASVIIHDPEKRVPSIVRLHSSPQPGAVMLATILDDVVVRHLREGNPAVLLIDSSDAIPGETGLKASIRAGSELDGRWFSNFNWIRRESPLFRDIAFGRILGFESAEVAPNYVIENVPPENFDDVLSGATFGWLHKNSALALQMKANDARLIATTFRFERYGEDAYATALLEAFIRYVGSGDCEPRFTLDLKN